MRYRNTDAGWHIAMLQPADRWKKRSDRRHENEKAEKKRVRESIETIR